jgi:hypothetical protein
MHAGAGIFIRTPLPIRIPVIFLAEFTEKLSLGMFGF